LKRRLVPFLALAAIALSAGVALAATTGTTINTANTHLGKILTSRRGFTLYMFSRDSKNRDNCVKIRGCISVWPAVTTKAKPVAGAGVRKSLLGTIKLPHGQRQVTYAGRPLYTYVGDSGPRDRSNIGLFLNGGFWYAVSPSGKVIK
jgi:predicted lipoprotein with Yx(FWY)xxD motif